MVDENATELLVVGAGVIGLSCRLAGRAGRPPGHRPRPGARRPGPPGWRAACSPRSPRRGRARRSCWSSASRSVGRWPAFAAELTDAAGRPAGLRTDGTIVAATGSGDRAELDTLAAHLARLGRPVDRLTGRELRRLEPGLGPEVRGGLSVPDDLAVDNRALLAALQIAAERAGAVFVGTARGGRAGRRDARRRRPPRRRDRAGGGHRPRRRGRALRRAAPGAARPGPAGEGRDPAPRAASRCLPAAPRGRCVRWSTAGRSTWCPARTGSCSAPPSPRSGFDTTVTVGGVRDLLRDAERDPVPGSREYALVEIGGGPAAGEPGQPAADRRARSRRPAGRHRPPPQRDAARARSPRTPSPACCAATACPSRSVRPTCSSPACPQVGIGPYRPLRGGSAWRLDQRGTPGAGVGRGGARRARRAGPAADRRGRRGGRRGRPEARGGRRRRSPTARGWRS